jgi:acyl transferase domain-containing protein
VTEALAAADIEPDDVGFVEAHASGTPFGDAIEVAALTRAYRAAGSRQLEQCALGAVKSNIANLDAAAGIAGLIKAVLACSEGVIPANLHFTKPHPDIELAGSPFFVPVKAVSWDGQHRLAGVSSLGLGGTNAHVVLASSPAPAEPTTPTGSCKLRLSARTPAELAATAQRLRRWLAEHPQASLADVAYTLAEGRHRFGCTASASARTVAEAQTALAKIEAGAAEDSDAGEPIGLGRKISLPTYPFSRRRHWIEPS